MVISTYGKINTMIADGKATDNVRDDLQSLETTKDQARISYKQSKTNVENSKADVSKVKAATSNISLLKHPIKKYRMLKQLNAAKAKLRADKLKMRVEKDKYKIAQRSVRARKSEIRAQYKSYKNHEKMESRLQELRKNGVEPLEPNERIAYAKNASLYARSTYDVSAKGSTHLPNISPSLIDKVNEQYREYKKERVKEKIADIKQKISFNKKHEHNKEENER